MLRACGSSTGQTSPPTSATGLQVNRPLHSHKGLGFWNLSTSGLIAGEGEAGGAVSRLPL